MAQLVCHVGTKFVECVGPNQTSRILLTFLQLRVALKLKSYQIQIICCDHKAQMELQRYNFNFDATQLF